jgi:hypothetical protein
MASKKSGKATKFARGSAAAFAVGLFLVGPAAVSDADAPDPAGPSAPPSAADSGSPSRGAAGPSRVARSAPGGATAGGPVARRGSAPAAVTAPEAAIPEVTAPAEVSIAQVTPSAPQLAVPVVADPVGSSRPAASTGTAMARPVPAPHDATAVAGSSAVGIADAASAVEPAVASPSEDAIDPAAVARLPRAAAWRGPTSLSASPVRESGAGSAPTAAAGVSSGGASAAGAAATASMVPAAPGSPLLMVSTPVNGIDTQVRTFFNQLTNWLDGLPANSVTTWMEGALAVLRRSLFNTAAHVVPSAQTTSKVDGKIRGIIGALDEEGDTLVYSVIADPTSGTVEMGADGSYAYTPGQGFTGTDSFTVQIAPQTPTVNLLNLGSSGARQVMIQIGAANRVDPADVALYLPSASGAIKVVNSNGLFGSRFTGTVTLKDLSPDTELTWLDRSGQRGSVSVEELASKYWSGLAAKAAENGASVNLTVSFTGAGGTQQALHMDDVGVRKDASGQYMLTGTLSANPEIQQNAVDAWDVLGNHFKPRYEDFLTTYSIGNGQSFKTVDIDFTQAAVFLDTFTPLSYKQAGLYALDSEANPNAAALPGTMYSPAPSTMTLMEAATASSESAVTASVRLGRSFAIGREDGSVALWTDGTEKVLKYAGGGWGSPVAQLLDYSRPLKDAQGNTVASSFTGYISGTTLTVTALGAGSTVIIGSQITGAGVKAGTTITKSVSPSGSAGGPGTYEVSIAQTAGSSVPPQKGSPAGITVTQTDVPAVAPAIVAGLGNGSVQLWTATTGWTELHDSGWKAGVTTMINYGEGVVVGLDNGSVRQWNGPGSNPDTSTWKNNWTELHNDGWNSGVTAMLPYKGRPDLCPGGCPGFLVGLANGSVQQYSDAKDGLGKPGWWELKGSGWDSKVMGFALSQYDQFGLPLVAVGLQNGAVQQWLDYGWDEIEQPGKNGFNSEITAMAQYGKNFVVGLKNGAVLERVNPSNAASYWVTLHDDGWKSQVNQIVPVKPGGGSGVYVGLNNGSVQKWSGQTAGTDPDSGQNYWTTLHDSGWDSGVARMVPVVSKVADSNGNVVSQDGVVVGLSNGALEQWSGQIAGGTGQNDWVQLPTETVNEAATVLKEDGVFKSAVSFAWDLAGAGFEPTWGAPGSIGSSADPLFSNPAFQSSATVSGTYTAFVYSMNKTLFSKEFTDPAGTIVGSVDVSYDVNAVTYGYGFVPDGILSKLTPGDYTVAAFTAVGTGPSLTVNLQPGPDGTIVARDWSMNKQWAENNWAVDVGFTADVTAKLINSTDTLNAHAYLVPGLLATFNTNSAKGTQVGFGYTPDVDYSDFVDAGLLVTATATPYVTASYDVPFRGTSLLKVTLGNENPLSATLTAGAGNGVSLALTAAGYVSGSVVFLGDVIPGLDWTGTAVYDENYTFSGGVRQ